MAQLRQGMSVVFAGGGTGGHIYPGLAVADELRAECEKKNIPLRICWIGNRRGMDREIVEKHLVSAGGSVDAFLAIPSGKLRRYVSIQNVIDVFKIIAGCIASLWLLYRIKPDCLFSKGGFVSVPPCWAARMLRIPYYTHECDVTPGLATRLNAGGAARILLSYQETARYFTARVQKKCLHTGNPVRPIFYTDQRETGRRFLRCAQEQAKPLLLVLGGSLGARQINELVIENLAWLTERFVIVHQTGADFLEKNPSITDRAGADYKIYPFVHAEMAGVIQTADIVLSRAGANSLWECAVCAKPLLLVPLCGAGTRGDQLDNARFFEEQGAALVLTGDSVDSEHLRHALEYLQEADNRQSLSDACRRICGTQKPAAAIAHFVLQETYHE